MINLPLNFSAPTAQAQNNYALPKQTNPYLTSSQYEGMQLHTPSGMYYQNGNFYQPYTVGTKQVNNYNPMFGTSFVTGGTNWSQPAYGGLNWGNQSYNTVPDIAEGSVQIGNQYFKPFTGNAEGVINGKLSVAAMLNKNPQIQAQGVPANLFNLLSNPNIQQNTNQQSYGAGRFNGLLGSPISTNVQGK